MTDTGSTWGQPIDVTLTPYGHWRARYRYSSGPVGSGDTRHEAVEDLLRAKAKGNA